MKDLWRPMKVAEAKRDSTKGIGKCGVDPDSQREEFLNLWPVASISAVIVER